MEHETIKTEEDDTPTLTVDDQDEPLVSEDTQAMKTKSLMTDVGNKMAIIYNVLKACIEEKRENVYHYIDNIQNKLAYLTNLPNNILSGIMYEAKERDILEESVLETPDKDILIRRTLAQYYIRKNKIPNSGFLTHITDGHRYNYQLQHQLIRSGYIWRRLHNTKKAIIVEHPKRVIERQRYLQTLFNHRQENRNIVYIETKIVTRADKDIRRFQNSLPDAFNYVIVFIAVANNNKGYLDGQIFFSKSIFKCQNLIEDYIVKNIIPTLSEPSVIILEDKPYYRKSLPVPTIESEKSEMIHWLEINGLPHKSNFHRSELFELIQKCTMKSDLHKFDAILHSHNHEILRRPSRTDYLNYYKPLWDNLPLNQEVTQFISKKNLEFWNNLEINIIHNEKCVFNGDLQMENVTDKILNLAKNTDVNKWADDDCDEEIDSLAQEEFFIKTKNTFSPEELQVREEQFLSEIKKFQRVKGILVFKG